ncbi:MAG: DUF1542 domain-containing protein [Desulfonauticus sp.]|nr:DUF1542 domain-containing protein [Desulfonauticus sp.]
MIYNQTSTSSKNLINAILSNDKLTEEEKSEIIANFLEEFNSAYPQLKYHATKQDVTETELRLIKEIEKVRKEIKEVELKLTREIEDVRKEIKEVELKLTREIEDVRKEIKEIDLKLTREIKETKSTLIKWSFGFWISQLGVLLSIVFLILRALK